MRDEKVSFYSEGVQLAGVLHLPDRDDGKPRAAIVQGPGFLGVKEAAIYLRWYEKFCAAGYTALAFDYRGWGDSEGEERGAVIPMDQVQDIRNAITYLQTRDDVDPNRIGGFGSGGTGGGNAIYVAAVDQRIKCTVCYTGIGSGRDWLRSMRREYEWIDLLKRLEEDRKQRVLTGLGAIVNAREELMIETPERRSTSVKKEVADKIPDAVPLRSGDAIMEFIPEDVVHRISPRAALFIGVENDAVTPEEQMVRMYQKAGEPKKLIMLKETSHYANYGDYFDEVSKAALDWYDRYLRYDRVQVTEL